LCLPTGVFTHTSIYISCFWHVANWIKNISMGHSPPWQANSHLVKKFSAYYGIRRFIAVLTTARHWSLSWARCIQSTPSHPISLRSILILPSHLRLGLTNGLFLQTYQAKYCMYFSSLPCMLHVPLI
jgi:hypothetical protein